MKTYYHYTTVEKLNQIIASGYIKQATAFLSTKKEKPITWVSTNPIWENSATKAAMDEFGNHFSLTFEEQLEAFGCARIIVKDKGYETWGKLKYLARIDLMVADELKEAGEKKGANSNEWFGTLLRIYRKDWIRAEIYEKDKWVLYQEF
jgi:hypothetical protein